MTCLTNRSFMAHMRLRLLAAVIAILAGSIVSTPAAAQIYPQCTITPAQAINFGTVNVPRDAPVGASIGSAQSSTVTVNCPATYISPYGFYLQFFPQLTASTVSNVWNTGVTGIGIKVVDVTYNNKILSSISSPSYGDFGPQTPSGTFSSPAYQATYTFTYQLVKTAVQVATGGTISIPTAMYLVSHNLAGNEKSPAQANISASGTIIATTCSVTTPSISVTLPDVKASVFSSVGTVAGNTNFTIGLTCQSGANVYVTLTDVTTPGNRTSNLTLAGGSTATGVQLRILNSGGSPVSYGADSAAPGNQNQWLVGASTSTTGVPLVVQYVSTGTVISGIVKGAATFTMSYQ